MVDSGRTIDNAPNNDPNEALEERKKKLYILVFCGLLFGLIALALAYGAFRVAKAPGQGIGDRLKNLSIQLAGQADPDADVAPAETAFRLLDGLPVQPGQEGLFPVAVMIDNHADARPQSGLAEAALVYEAEAEGGLTRYMAVFADPEKAARIGPVRSARPYFVDWARELSALYVHVGGSPEALAYLAKDGAPHLNEFYNGQYFWRDPVHAAPHNVYTSGDNLARYLEAKGLDQAAFFPWPYKEDAPAGERPATSSVRIDLRMAGYLIDWRYDRDNNQYLRYLGGRPHQDEGGNFIIAKNIAIQEVPAKVLDEYLRLRMETTGQGPAMLCRDGACQKCEWRKKSATERTRFYGESGEELAFNRGTTWVEVVQPGTEVGY